MLILIMTYTAKNGNKWYLHKRNTIIGRNKIKTVTYFFRKEKKEDLCQELPFGWTVIETRTGLPIVKKV